MDGTQMPVNNATITWAETQAATSDVEARLSDTHAKADALPASSQKDALIRSLNRLHNELIDQADALADKFSPTGGALYSGGRPKTKLTPT